MTSQKIAGRRQRRKVGKEHDGGVGVLSFRCVWVSETKNKTGDEERK